MKGEGEVEERMKDSFKLFVQLSATQDIAESVCVEYLPPPMLERQLEEDQASAYFSDKHHHEELQLHESP